MLVFSLLGGGRCLTFGFMARLPDPLRRHGVALALTAAAVWVFIGATLPALEERTLQRKRAEAAELQRADQADQVRRHELLASHAVWLIYKAHEAEPAAEERLGDCGMFLGTRSEIDAQLWRAFYDYARLILKLGHFESFVDSDVKAALVHSSAECCSPARHCSLQDVQVLCHTQRPHRLGGDSVSQLEQPTWYVRYLLCVVERALWWVHLHHFS